MLACSLGRIGVKFIMNESNPRNTIWDRNPAEALDRQCLRLVEVITPPPSPRPTRPQKSLHRAVCSSLLFNPSAILDTSSPKRFGEDPLFQSQFCCRITANLLGLSRLLASPLTVEGGRMGTKPGTSFCCAWRICSSWAPIPTSSSLVPITIPWPRLLPEATLPPSR